MVNRNTKYLEVKDFSVSKEIFELNINEEFGFLETRPQPSKKELARYYDSEDYISHTDTKRNLFEKVYHLVRTIALKRKLKLINTCTSDTKRLLDVGCGTGDFLLLAKQNGWDITGIEPNSKAREIANKKNNNVVSDDKGLSVLEKESFDVITLWHVLEHLPDLEEHVQLFQYLLKPKGRLVIALPNFKSYDAKYYKSFWAAFDVPRHLWHFSKNSVAKLFLKYGMAIEVILPMKFDAFYVSLLSEKHKTGKLNPIRSFWVASRSNFKAHRSKEYSSLIYVIKNN
ncbi:MAG: class I SAM-dependent methyltransferase [Flavobacteriaceae bacterium]|nr:class I SAM-dependent methyltransferase [Flavobacteriaceae bacterium]